MNPSTGTEHLSAHLQQQKQKLRNALRQEYWKKITKPPTDVYGETIFDPGHQRYVSMNATRSKNFRPTAWNGFLFFAMFVVPFSATVYMFKKDRETREALLRSGQVAYKDRNYKFI
ncbi:NADH dehydrogenase (ubiquinone) B15 subunit [Lycorma delicatula]|uniref:NADH dehydrogenase (ubiquinone) B15 subunit n=1 Tax=Lycorma delicatula TaxID=130591 RepID=UPI003F510EC8